MIAAAEGEHDDDPSPAAGYRTYEVYQRERVAESTNQLRPRELIGDEMLTSPHRLLTILREHHPCYRDWVGNQFWVTRYDDVTSIFADDANYETRSKRWMAGQADFGRDLRDELQVQQAIERRTDEALDVIVEQTLADLVGYPDLALAFAARVPLGVWAAVLDLPAADLPEFTALYWRMQRSASWDAQASQDGRAAAHELATFLQPLLERRRIDPGDDVISAAAGLDLDGCAVEASDIVATIWESDHETLHGGLANMWCQLLLHPEQFEAVRADRRLVKFAWLETLRHSPPVQSAARFARHEVERFGRLLPEGALLRCSAAAANRDPRAFNDPDSFLVERTDLCQREPRGQYRADGLPSGIAFGLGKPSVHPAVPKERPRSIYAITRDVAVRASHMLLDAYPQIRLADAASPEIRSLRLGEMSTCWNLPVRW